MNTMQFQDLNIEPNSFIISVSLNGTNYQKKDNNHQKTLIPSKVIKNLFY